MTRRRPLLAAAFWLAGLVSWLVVLAAPNAQAGTPPKWIQRIQEVVGDRPFSIAIGNDGDYWYRSQAWRRRPPASNEKLLLSMTLFGRYGTTRTIRTSVMRSGPVSHGVVRGDLWLLGRGDPELDHQAISRLAAAIDASGIHRIRGGVRGSTGPFARDWWAKGWRDYFPDLYIALPTALAFERNEDSAGRHITDPERRAAIALTTKLEARGVRVRDAPGAGSPPGGMKEIASLDSAPLDNVVRHMNLESRNFWAEVLGKRLGADVSGKGTIAAGAKAICAYAARHGQDFACYDASGLSYANRASALGILQLLWDAQARPWGDVLRSTLPTGGQGTLEDRLQDVRLRAKTGTLQDVSALSGWVWLQRSGQWGEFSIMSSGFDDATAKTIENKIVRAVSANASDPDPND